MYPSFSFHESHSTHPIVEIVTLIRIIILSDSLNMKSTWVRSWPTVPPHLPTSVNFSQDLQSNKPDLAKKLFAKQYYFLFQLSLIVESHTRPYIPFSFGQRKIISGHRSE